MSLPAIRALKQVNPNYRIYVLCKQYLSSLYLGIKEISEVITIPNKINSHNFLETARFIKGYKFERGVLFTNSFGSALLFRAAGIKYLTGYGKDLRHFLLKQCVPYPHNDKHHVYFYLDLVASFLGMDLTQSYSDQLIIQDEEKSLIQRKLEKMGVNISAPLVGISPSAAYGTAKQWLPGRFSELIQRIAMGKKKKTVLLFGTGAEKEKIDGIVAGVKNTEGIFNLAGQLSLREAIIAISLCSVFVSNDSGLMHTASSLRVPLVAIFGPTLPHKTSPLSSHSHILYKPMECAPCLHRDCPIDHPCMAAVSVDEVMGKIHELCGEDWI